MRCDYILFTHLPKYLWKEDRWQIVETYANELGKVLRRDPPGMLIVFSDVGWLSLLNTVGADFDPVKLSQEFHEIEDLEEKVRQINEQYPDLMEGDLSRLRLITAKDLYPIVNNIRGNKPGNEAVRLRRFLVSEDLGVFYDTAKVVEALVRIRHVGSGIPVVRIDWDALFNEKTLRGMLKNSLYLVQQYSESYAREPLIHSSMLSGEYAQPDSDQSEWDLSDYNVAYATRVFPALIPTDAAVEELNVRTVKDGLEDCEIVDSQDSGLVGPQQATMSELQAWGMFDRDIVRDFYGDRRNIGWEGIAEIGAHPLNSVISGSLLVLSDGAILDLPPFSNFRKNVMWIDDHLKYLLHQSLGHFRRLELNVGTQARERMFTVRIKDCEVYKDRVLAGQKNLRWYTLNTYIPTLFWGTILDAWIQPKISLKPPVIDELSTDAGPLSRYLGQALRRGSFPEEKRDKLREELTEAAIVRADAVRKKWLQLKRPIKNRKEEKSFAALWVGGDRDAIKEILSPAMRQNQAPDWIGWGLLAQAATQINRLSDLSDEVQRGIQVLVEDAITYLDWALEWPSFVRSVRAVRSGSLRSDVSFETGNITD